MKRALTAQLFSVIAIVAFTGANGLTASGLHALAHAAEVTREADSAGEHGGHHAAGHGQHGEQQHDDGSSEQCSCFGTCAGVTPPSTTPVGALVGTGLTPSSPGPVARGALGVTPRLTDYLFPLPNAPPVRT